MRALFGILSFILLCALSSVSHAGVITKTNGKVALMDFAGETPPENGATLPIKKDGKTIGRIKIVQIKGSRAKGNVTAGRAEEGAQVGDGGGGDMAGLDGGSKRRGGRGSSLFNGTVWGFQFGYIMDTQSVTFSTGTVSMSGSGMALKAFWNFPISGNLRLDARTGYEQLSVKGALSGVNFNTSISYITGDGILRYHLGNLFFGLGACIYYPLSSDSTALDKSKIGLTTLFTGDVGYNYVMGESFLQAVFEYQMYPPSNDVKTTGMGIRFGYGWRW